MPAHSFLIHSHLYKSGSEPAGFQITVEIGCPVRRMKRQPSLPGHVLTQVLCDIAMQVDFSLGGIGFEVMNNAGSVLFDLLLD